MLSCQKQSLLKKISSWRSQGAMKTCNSSSHLQESCWKNPFNYCCIVWTNVKGRKGCWSPEFQLEIFLTRNGEKETYNFEDLNIFFTLLFVGIKWLFLKKKCSHFKTQLFTYHTFTYAGSIQTMRTQIQQSNLEEYYGNENFICQYSLMYT